MKVLKGKYFLACYIKVNYPRILVDFMAVKPNNKTMMMLFLQGVSHLNEQSKLAMKNAGWTIGTIFTFGRSQIFGPDKLRPPAVAKAIG